MSEQLDIKALSKIKTPGKWVVGADGGLSAVFDTGFWSKDIIIPESRLKNLYAQAFNACSDVIGKLQEADSARMKSTFGERKTVDWFSFVANSGNTDMEKKYQTLERVRDILLETIQSKDTALKARNMTLEF